MVNATKLLSTMPFLHRFEMLEDLRLLAFISITLIILLWCASKFENHQIVMDVLLRQRRQDREFCLFQQLQQESSESSSSETDDPMTPQPFGRLNPIQSVERKQRQSKHENFPAPASMTACRDGTPARSRPSFAGLNPEQSVERRRRIRLHTMNKEPKGQSTLHGIELICLM